MNSLNFWHGALFGVFAVYAFQFLCMVIDVRKR